MTDGRVRVERIGHVGVLTLDRPDKLNALTMAMVEQLRDESRALDADPGVRAIVVTGAGNRAFCVGGDLHDLLPRVLDAGRDVLNPDPEVRFFSDVCTPVIAAVGGLCLGGGFEIMLGTDLRIVGSSASLGLPEVGVGLIPGSGSTVRLAEQVSWAHAMQLLLTGDPISAAEALRIGLVNEVVPDGEALDRALAVAERIARNGPVAVRTAKEIAVRTRGLAAAFRLEHELNSRVITSADAHEGVAAFRERRDPEFDNT
ncbi:MAG: enoyl-CoA hydratase/isomerase family protein [Aeromicrobium sp.]